MSENKQSNKDEKSLESGISILPFIVFACITLLACIIYGLVICFQIEKWEERGQFGDMFGGLNALFSGVAFAGVVYAIILQRKELAMQREEMRLSRQELAAQNQLISAQLSTMQSSFDFEKTKENLSSEPLFRMVGGSNSANVKKIDLQNLGGRISDISLAVVSPEKGISMNVTPTDVWEVAEKGQVEINGFGGSPCPECKVLLNFTDKLARERSLPFTIPAGTCEFIPTSDLPNSEDEI